MKKKLAVLLTSLSITCFSTNAYAIEPHNDNKVYKISESVLDYTPDPNSPYNENKRKELYDKIVDPGKAMGLSALYFGLGQMYSGETQKGALILAGGTLLAATVFLVALPAIDKDHENARGTGVALSFLALGTAYVLNIRDAYNTAEAVNADIKNKIMTSDNYLYHLDKIGIKSKESTISLTYNLKF